MSIEDPQTYAEWLAAGFTGYPPDFTKWLSELDMLALRVVNRMATTGIIPWRTGSVPVTLLTTTVAVAFGTKFFTDDYTVLFSLEGIPIAVQLSSDQHTKDGFRLRIGLSIAATIKYVAIPNQG